MVATSLSTTLTATAQTEVDYTPDQFNRLFDGAPLSGVAPVGAAPAITGDAEIDARIRAIAQDRGYRRRPVASGALASVDGFPAQPTAAEAWRSMRADAAASGITLVLNSAFRGIAVQRSVFVSALDGTSDAAIDERLEVAAPPGYSKHHTGYAIDITQAAVPIDDFRESEAFAWLSADGFANARRHGFIPSYPAGAADQGPQPEAWEYTWVGVDMLRCGGFGLGMETGAAAANPTGSLSDLDVCAGLALTRGATAFYLARAFDLAETGTDPFTDTGSLFADGAARLVAAGIASGCNPPASDRFCPFHYLTRGEMATFLARAIGLEGEAPDAFDDDDGSVHEDSIELLASAGLALGCDPPANTRFCPEELVTRGQLGTFLQRVAASGLAPVVTTWEPPGPYEGRFADDDASIFEDDIEWIASRGITVGCDPPVNTRFCPDDSVTRGQMAAFLTRALHLPPGPDAFTDDDSTVFETDIDALASAGITTGCNPPANTHFCPEDSVTRGQMAAFLARALDVGST